MTTPDGTQPSFDEVLDQVMAADPDTFYQKARAFENVVTVLQDARAFLAKQHRMLEELWTTPDPGRFNRLEQVIRHLETLLSRYRYPNYVQVLRRIGDVIRDSQQRLLSMKDDHGDHAARADRDKRARKILADLSSSYRQLGESLQELPERTADGDILPASFTQGTTGAYAPAPRVGVGRVLGTAGTKAHGGTRAFGAAQTQPELTGGAALSNTPAPFARFAHYATRPAPPGHGRTEPSFTGFAGMADPGPQAAPFVLTQPGVGSSRSPRDVAQGKGNVPAADTSAGLGQRDQLVTLPAKLESIPGVGVSAKDVPVTTAGPAPASGVAAPPGPAPAAPQVSLTGSTARVAAPAPATPAASDVPVAPPPPPGPPAAAVATNASAAPLAMSAGSSLTSGSAMPGSMMRAGLTPVPMANVVGAASVPRGAEVWLRADASNWNPGTGAQAPLGREHLAGHHLTADERACGAVQRKEAQ
ncbi:hypothetical protein [Kutzneria kofuensis]|uniref:Uncharacterized protein n=1 Tax=Kutzneria kofuensis TaxID=103725 RepID=A0A7W9NLI4_9PSEU|nr:hypothetical protein [Kutzneria kofuensis]MBB5896318.1 hypothetical protein [Kutzneria kofuensis]